MATPRYTFIADSRYPMWPAHSSALNTLLGFKHTPVQGMEPRYVNATHVGPDGEHYPITVKVWVRPLAPKPEGVTRRLFQGLRIRAACPFCAKEVAAGRLAQHRC